MLFRSVPVTSLTMDCPKQPCGTFASSGAVTIESTPTTPTNVTINGGTLSGTGVLTLTQHTNTTVGGPFSVGISRPVANAGTWTQTGYASLGAAFTNSGTLVFPDNTGYIAGGAGGALTNTGLITKTGGTGTNNITAPTSGSGTFTIVPGGTLFVTGDVTAPATGAVLINEIGRAHV